MDAEDILWATGNKIAKRKIIIIMDHGPRECLRECFQECFQQCFQQCLNPQHRVTMSVQCRPHAWYLDETRRDATLIETQRKNAVVVKTPGSHRGLVNESAWAIIHQSTLDWH